MRYTFTDPANGNTREVTIPDDYIRDNCRRLGISAQNAIMMYLSDEGYIEDETVKELSKKAKSAKVDKGTGRKSVPKKKDDVVKHTLMEKIFKFTKENLMCGDRKPANVVLLNPERLLSFSLGDDDYEITLTRKRKSK